MLRLDLATMGRPRTIALGEGVSVTVRGASYAQVRAAEAAAAAVVTAAMKALEGVDDELLRRRELRAAQGEADAAFADQLVADCADGWNGVGDQEGAALPLTAETWRAFRDAAPRLAERVVEEITRPATLLAAEGNGSAASPSGAGEAA